METTRPEICAGPTERNFSPLKVPLDMGSSSFFSFSGAASGFAGSDFSLVFAGEVLVSWPEACGFCATAQGTTARNDRRIASRREFILNSSPAMMPVNFGSVFNELLILKQPGAISRTRLQI